MSPPKKTAGTAKTVAARAPAKKANARATAKTAKQRAFTRERAEVAGNGPVAHIEDVERFDLAHMLAIVRKWAVLVVAGVLFILASTAVLLRLSPPPFEAEAVLQFDQPRVVATGEQGRATVAKLASLMPTYAQIAVSDPVLDRVRRSTGSDNSVETLRGALTAEPVALVLAVRIGARDASSQQAELLASATATALIEEVDETQAQAGVPAEFRFAITPLIEPDARRPARNDARTLVLSSVLGFLIMVGVAFLLEYVERP